MSKTGIDVSVWNGRLDWAALKKAGVAFAIIRTGYGTSHTDSEFARNMDGAIANGIPVGVYHFSYALDAAGAKREAEYVAKLLEPYKDKITLPVFFDFEYDTVDYAKKQGVTLGKTAFNTHTVAFCEAIRAAGYIPGVYYNLDYYRRFVDDTALAGYIHWYAQYASSASIDGWDLWQFTSTGKLSGVSGTFDVNVLANEDLLTGGKYTGPTGWQKNDTGWWYVHEDGSYTTDDWEQIDGKWYHFDKEGYMQSNRWIIGAKTSYYLGNNGVMATNKTLKINAEGELVPAGDYYEKLSDVPSEYRSVLHFLIASGIIKGRGGSGEDLVIDLSEEAVRVLVMLDRAGLFG